MMTLAELPLNQSAVIEQLPDDYELSIRLMEQGFAPNAQVSVAHKAPFNGPIAVRILGTKLAIKASVAAQIKVTAIA